MQPGVGTVEGGHEPVVFDGHDLTVVMTDDLAHEHVVVAEQLGPLLWAKALSDLLRVVDVAEHQGQRAIGRAQPSEVRQDRLERRGNDVDRGEWHVRCGGFSARLRRPEHNLR